MRWNWSRCSPSASATMALITSPCVHATQTASAPSRASQSRTAATARAAISGRLSPFGNRTADGCACTTFHSGSFASSLIGRPVQSP